MTPGVGPRIAARLLEHFGSARAVFDAPRTELERLGLSEETVASIIARDQHERAERELASVRALGGDLLVLDDGAYPALLREIHDPPLALYVRGAWKECLEAPCIAMVGSRRCSTYGQNAATMLARDLAERGVTIISGLARGIDAASHRGALEADGRTVAVLGTGSMMSTRASIASSSKRFWRKAGASSPSFRSALRRWARTSLTATASSAD